MDLRELKEFIKDSIGFVLIFITVFFVLLYVVAFEIVHGTSMSPNYNSSDVVLLSKISYKLHDIKIGDVVALTDADGVLYVKRIIAGPGDHIYARNNKIYLNNYILEEEYLENVKTDDFTFDDVCRIMGCENGGLPEDRYFVLGDNREDSFDSRFEVFGLVKKENILGKVIFKIWPFGFSK